MCACRRRDDAEDVRMPVVRGRSRSVVDVSGNRVHLSLVRRIGGVVVSSPLSFSEKMSREESRQKRLPSSS
eukprot:2898481-Pleurochrysis_carterae.AAC.1